jgi:hypothetical protein
MPRTDEATARRFLGCHAGIEAGDCVAAIGAPAIGAISVRLVARPLALE